MKRYFAFLFIATFAFASCATQKDTLVLENILDEQARLKAIEAEEAELAQKAAAIEAAKFVPLTPQEIYESSKAEPRELVFLDLPKAFVFMDKSLYKTAVYKNLLDKLSLTNPSIWVYGDNDVINVVGADEIDESLQKDLSRAEFKAALAEIADKVKADFEATKNAQVSVRLHDEGRMFVLEIVSKFLEKNVWWSDRRYHFYYNRDYRLSMFSVGRESFFEQIMPEYKASIELFKASLMEIFKEGLVFGAGGNLE